LLGATSPASASEKIFETWNPAACEVTDTAAFTIDSPVHLDRIEIWYRWAAGETSVDYTVAFNGKAIGVGTLVRGDCDPGQEAWCVAHAEPGAKLVPGSYTIKTERARICRNAASGGHGFIRAFGTRRKTEPAPPQTASSSDWPRPSEETLFDGKLDDHWVQHSAEGGDFERDARLENGALVVNVPSGNGDGNVGILSPKALVWLDDFGLKAETTVTFNFDPAQTTGFAVSLAVPGYGGVRGNPPGAPDRTMVWTQSPDGKSAKAEFYENLTSRKPFRTLDLPPAGPSKATVTLRPYEIAWSIHGGEEVVAEFPEARPGQGLHLYVYSQAAVRDAPVAMKLKSIVLHRKADPAVPATKVIEQVDVFDGKEDAKWEPVGIEGGDFSKFARYDNGQLVVDVPEGNFWGTTGVLSVNPVVQVEAYSDIAPYRFTVTTDPARSKAFFVALGADRTKDMWSYSQVWVGLQQGQDGRYALEVYRSGYEDWERTFAGPWNGDLLITIGIEGMSVSVPGGPTISAPALIRDFGGYYLGVFTHPKKAGEAGSFALKSITRERLIPADMPADELWNFQTPEQFDPAAFMRDLEGNLFTSVFAEGAEEEQENEGVSP
jgi:hypothetical protein